MKVSLKETKLHLQIFFDKLPSNLHLKLPLICSDDMIKSSHLQGLKLRAANFMHEVAIHAMNETEHVFHVLFYNISTSPFFHEVP